MPIEFYCEGCSNHLRVPDEHAGKQARCPSCDHVNAVPLASVPVVSRQAGMTDADRPVAEQPQAHNPYSATASPVSKMPLQANSAVYPFKPLYDSAFFIKFAAWYNIISGALACLTIIGIVYGWLPIWIGVCLKNAARDIEIGYANSDPGLLYNASANLATVAKIVGVLMMIGVAFIALYLIVLIFAILAGAVGILP